MLTSKISLLVSLAVLLGVLLVQPSKGQTWADFKRKHVDPNHPSPDSNLNLFCERRMRNQGMTRYHCKYRNTFIHEQPNVIQQVCQGSGTPAGSFTKSIFRYGMTDCHFTGGTPPNHCQYHGVPKFLRIVVKCDPFVMAPIHLDQIVP